MTKDVNLDQLQKDAVEIFNQGFACSESIIYAIKKNFELEMSDDAIAMSSGFPWGLAVAAASAELLPVVRCVSDTFSEEKLREIQKSTNVFN